MKRIYKTRNAMFRDINMLLCNKVTEVDESFIEDNYDLFSVEPNDDDVNEKIADLSSIDWSKEEYKPFDITESMTSSEIVEHLTSNYFEEVRQDIESHEIEPYQYYLTMLDDYKQEEFKAYNVPFGYSEALGLHVIPIYDFGTGWNAFSYSKEVDDDYELQVNETEARTTVY